MARSGTTRRGVAMMLVVSVVALTVVLGAAMLASSSLQAQAERNSVSAAAADSLAESGIELASYYLLKPWKAPPFSGVFWPGAQNISLGNSVPGSIDISVAFAGVVNGRERYAITSTGRLASPAGTLRRTLYATIDVTPYFHPKYGAAFDAVAVTIPSGSSITSDIQVNGTLVNYGSIVGTVRSKSWNNLGFFSGVFDFLDETEKTDVPGVKRLTDYRTYVWQGNTYSAVRIPAAPMPGSVYGPTPANPAGVFYRDGTVTLAGYVTINGTLQVDGALVITGPNNFIRPTEGFPGLIAKSGVDLRHSLFTRPDLTVNGLAWLGDSIVSSLLLGTTGPVSPGTFAVNGALLVSGAGVQVKDFKGKVAVTHNRQNVGGLSFVKDAPPPGVAFVSFR